MSKREQLIQIIKLESMKCHKTVYTLLTELIYCISCIHLLNIIHSIKVSDKYTCVVLSLLIHIRNMYAYSYVNKLIKIFSMQIN